MDYFELARTGRLPEGFSDWHLTRDEGGWTVAHVAAERGPMPPDFDRWELSDTYGWTVAHVAATHGHLPPGFDRWAIRDKFGRTVAREAMLRGQLPAGFDRWDIAAFYPSYHDGSTIAHEAAEQGILPPDFDRWELVDNNGRTVAHEAAYRNDLPPDFDRWELARPDGWTVAHTEAIKGSLPKGFNRWDLADRKGMTVAHVAAFQGHLPPDFDRWELADRDGWTVAHEAAFAGTLPEDFTRWGLDDGTGWTVAAEHKLRLDTDKRFEDSGMWGAFARVRGNELRRGKPRGFVPAPAPMDELTTAKEADPGPAPEAVNEASGPEKEAPTIRAEKEGPLQWLAPALGTSLLMALFALIAASLVFGLLTPPVRTLCLKGRRYVTLPYEGRMTMAMILDLSPEGRVRAADRGERPPDDVAALSERLTALIEAGAAEPEDALTQSERSSE